MARTKVWERRDVIRGERAGAWRVDLSTEMRGRVGGGPTKSDRGSQVRAPERLHIDVQFRRVMQGELGYCVSFFF